MSTQSPKSDIDFSGESFVVKSALIGTEYVIKTAAGEELLWAERHFFEDGITYVYTDDVDDERFRYESAEESDRLRFVDVTNDRRLATLERVDQDDRYRWQLDPERNGIRVEIVGEEGTVPVLDPQKGRHMSITGPDGEEVGYVDRRLLAIHFMFDVEIPGLDRVGKAAVILAVPPLYDAMRNHSSTWRQ